MASEKENSATMLGEIKQWIQAEFDKSHAKQDEILAEVKTRLDTITGELFEAKQKCDELERQNQKLDTTVSEQQEQICQLEAYVKKDNLRFYNIPESRNGETEKDLRDFMTKYLNINHSDIEFGAVHRVGPLSNNNNQPRCILGKFTGTGSWPLQKT